MRAAMGVETNTPVPAREDSNQVWRARVTRPTIAISCDPMIMDVDTMVVEAPEELIVFSCDSF